MNFGGIGVIFGHELTHAFDNEGWYLWEIGLSRGGSEWIWKIYLGKEHDESGNLVPWWSEDSSNMFEQKAQCFVEQYSNYSCKDIPVQSVSSRCKLFSQITITN